MILQASLSFIQGDYDHSPRCHVPKRYASRAPKCNSASTVYVERAYFIATPLRARFLALYLPCSDITHLAAHAQTQRPSKCNPSSPTARAALSLLRLSHDTCTTHRPPPTPDEPAARAADRRNGSPSTRARAPTSSVLSLPALCAVWHRRSSARAASRARSDRIARAIASAASTGISKRPRYSRQRAHRCRHTLHVAPPVRDCAAATCLRRARRPSPSPRCAPSAAKAPLARNPLAPPAERSQLPCVPSSSGAGLPVNRRPLRVPAQSSDRAVTRGHARLPCRDDGLPLAAPSAHVQSPKCAHSRPSFASHDFRPSLPFRLITLIIRYQDLEV